MIITASFFFFEARRSAAATTRPTACVLRKQSGKTDVRCKLFFCNVFDDEAVVISVEIKLKLTVREGLFQLYFSFSCLFFFLENIFSMLKYYKYTKYVIIFIAFTWSVIYSNHYIMYSSFLKCPKQRSIAQSWDIYHLARDGVKELERLLVDMKNL